MSVVAGCSLFNGVILLADCRATLLRPGRKPVYIDNLLKLFALTPTTAIGFVSDITITAQLLREGLANLRRHSGSSRVHPIKVLN